MCYGGFVFFAACLGLSFVFPGLGVGLSPVRLSGVVVRVSCLGLRVSEAVRLWLVGQGFLARFPSLGGGSVCCFGLSWVPLGLRWGLVFPGLFGVGGLSFGSLPCFGGGLSVGGLSFGSSPSFGGGCRPKSCLSPCFCPFSPWLSSGCSFFGGLPVFVPGLSPVRLSGVVVRVFLFRGWSVPCSLVRGFRPGVPFSGLACPCVSVPFLFFRSLVCVCLAFLACFGLFAWFVVFVFCVGLVPGFVCLVCRGFLFLFFFGCLSFRFLRPFFGLGGRFFAPFSCFFPCFWLFACLLSFISPLVSMVYACIFFLLFLLFCEIL